MRRILASLSILIMILFCQFTGQAQTTGSIGGTITDSNGAVLPNATITVKGDSGQQFTAVSSDNGTYSIPGVAAGLYTVSITSSGFKKSLVSNVKVDVGLPTTVNSSLEVGTVEQIVEVTTGGEVLQTQTATVGTNITGRQITETAIASRNALDLVGLLPGTATVGRPRQASVNGLPKGSLSITVDGVDAQDNLLRSSDGYFTYVQPKIDAIEEVTVSTAVPGAESAGDGAVQIKFVTKRGTNRYSGGVFEQVRNTSLNAAYFFNNRDLKPLPGQTKAPRNVIQLNQYGARLGGPLPLPHFGEGGPMIHSGKDRSFFFFNYEEYRLPESQSRTRVVLTPAAAAGNYSYVAGGITNTVNLLTVASNAGRLSTADPTIAAVFAKINAATATTGTLTPNTASPNLQNYNFTPQGGQVRRFLALRFDFNITKNHSVEFVKNRQRFVPAKDFLNAVEERFPGFPSYGQGSIRKSTAVALRSTLATNIINEARYTTSGGFTNFFPTITPDDFGFQGGYSLGLNAASFGGTAISSQTALNSKSGRTSPTYDFSDSLTWIAGNHNLSFGGNYKLIKLDSFSTNPIVPTVGFGLDSSDTAFSIFSTTTLPNASAAQLTEARNLYAVLVGRVLSFGSTAALTSDGTYKVNAETEQRTKQNTFGLFAQDSWRIRQNFSVNFGVRWQPQTAFIIDSANFGKISNFADLWGVSGQGNLFKPGTLTGTAPTIVAAKVGEKAYNDDMDNFAPSFGMVYSPNFGDSGILHTIFGGSGSSVFRAGYSVSYVREGTNLFLSILGSNPGATLPATRNLTNGNLTVGTNLRDANNPNLTPGAFSPTPTYPLSLTPANSINGFDPNVKTGQVRSFSFGYQREIDKNTVIEFRYVGNRGVGLQRQYNLNEFNTIENGFADEFALAQANLYANEAAFAAGNTSRRLCTGFINASGGCQTSATNTTAVARVPTFAFFGAGTGTSALPIMMSYFNGVATNLPNNPAGVNGSPYNANFGNSTLVAALSRNAPSIATFAGTNFENNAARRANGIANGRASNFFYVNPATASSGSFIVDNTAQTWYDSGIIEVRRRLSAGLRVQANYVWSKAQTDSFQSSSAVFSSYSLRPDGLQLAKTVQPFDISHAFKMDATYDLPFGKGRAFASGNGFVDTLLGGFSILPTIRWQSGSPIQIGNVQLVGMTVEELQKEVKVRKGATLVTWLPDDIILNSQRAFDINVANSTGYGTTFGGTAGTGTAPTGRFIAPAGYNNCVSTYAGKCGFNNLVIYGPDFFKFDVSVAKKFSLGERRNIELKATALDVLNRPNFRVGGWTADITGSGCCGSTFGQLGNGTAYQDVSTTNDPGGRLIDLMIRFNF